MRNKFLNRRQSERSAPENLKLNRKEIRGRAQPKQKTYQHQQANRQENRNRTPAY